MGAPATVQFTAGLKSATALIERRQSQIRLVNIGEPPKCQILGVRRVRPHRPQASCALGFAIQFITDDKLLQLNELARLT
jgi:hypothetical protein